jgi:tetratricopeptide (TPR) repeat protein
MKWFFLVLLFFAPLIRASAADDETARAFADQGEWRSAAVVYEKMLDAHPLDPGLHYNLGLCLDEVGDVGRAVLAYERSLLLTPRASDARRNLVLLRESHSLPELGMGGKGLPAFTSWLSTGEWQWLCVLAAIVMIGASWWCVLRASPQGRSFPLTLAVVAFWLMLGSAAVMHLRKGEEKRAVITATDASLLLSPFPSAEVITACPPGSMLVIKQAQGSFFYAEMLPQGTKGWLPQSSVQQVSF